MGAELLDNARYGLYDNKLPTPRIARQGADASVAECLVYASRGGLYVLVCIAWRGDSARYILYSKGRREDSRGYRQSAWRRLSVVHLRNALGRIVGKTGVGRVLELGRKGGVGCSHLVYLSGGDTPATSPTKGYAKVLCSADRSIFITADVLVWSKLSPIGYKEHTLI